MCDTPIARITGCVDIGTSIVPGRPFRTAAPVFWGTNYLETEYSQFCSIAFVSRGLSRCELQPPLGATYLEYLIVGVVFAVLKESRH